MTRGRSIGVAQTVPRRGDVGANIEDHIRLAEAAAARQARVLVFPELSLTGYELDFAADLAFSERDPRLDPFIDVAFSRDMTLVVGAPVRLGPRLHIGAFIFSPDWSVELYTKHHLGAFPTNASPDGIVPAAENTVFQPGDRNPLLWMGDEVGAVAVCADASRPYHPKKAAQRGATVYLASMFVLPVDLETEAARLRSYAARHSMVVAFANYGGPTGGLASAGGSAIWSETGELLAKLDGAGSGIAVAHEGSAGWRGEAVMLAGS